MSEAASTRNCKRKRKRYQKKSKVWNHFTEIEKGDGDLREETTCNYCSSVFKCGSIGTTTMWKHIHKCDEYPYNELRNSSTIPSQRNWRFNQERCREGLARVIILDALPFSHMENVGFRGFCVLMQPSFQLVSRTTITKDCVDLYLYLRKNLKEVFDTSSSRVCLTTDLWTSVRNLGYMCLTAHYIDKDWKLQKRIINFCVLATTHRDDAIAQAVEKCLLEWGIEKICIITVDNASSNNKVVTNLVKRFQKWNGLLLNGEFFHMKCNANILNLIVNEGLKVVKDSLTRLRGSVKYVRSSSSRLQAFKKCVEVERIFLKKSLCLDVPTRWNSTYLMLSAAIEHNKALDHLAGDPNFLPEVCEVIAIEEKIAKTLLDGLMTAELMCKESTNEGSTNKGLMSKE